MANLQFLLPPISAVGNQSAAMHSTGRTTLEAQRDSSNTAEAAGDEASYAEHSFSRLLNDSSDSKPIERDKNRALLGDSIKPDSVSPSGLAAAELTLSPGNKSPLTGPTLPHSIALVFENLAAAELTFSQGNKSPLTGPAWLPPTVLVSENLAAAELAFSPSNKSPLTGPTLLPSTALVFENLAAAELAFSPGNKPPLTGAALLPSTALVSENLAEGFYQISADQQSLPALSQRAAGYVDNGLDSENTAPELLESENTTPELIESVGQNAGETALSYSLLGFESDTGELLSYNTALVGAAADTTLISSGESDLSIDTLLINSEVASVTEVQLTPQKPIAETRLQQTESLRSENNEIVSLFNEPHSSDPNVKASQVATSAGASMASALNSDELRHARTKGADFLNTLDVLGSGQNSEAEFSKFEGVAYSQSSVVSEKAIQLMSGNSLGAAAADVGAPQNQSVSNNTSLTNALSQWRVEQDSGAVNTDPLERQGFAKLSVPFNQSGWGENLGRQLSLLLAKNMDSAQIQLDPPELGPLGVKIQINQDQVSLQFTSGHAVVREALEQSSQRLQQMLNDEGLELIDVGVSDRKSGQNSDSNQNQDQGEATSKLGESFLGGEEEGDGLLTPVLKMAIDDGNIDYFI